jgi:DNA polymerase-3 subunit gamma/tau
LALYNKYRPQSLEEVVGNHETVLALKNILEKEEKPHAYLFYGPTGCGKTTLGRIVAKYLGCEGDDFREIDSADFRGIDTVRAIRKQAYFKPIQSKTRVWLIDEVHKMTNDAQNALLKILEDPPNFVYFILATTEPQKLIPTIRGRCVQFSVAPLSEIEMKKLLRRIVKAEGATLNKEVYDQIVQDSLGHPRNAIQILEQVLSVPPEKQLEVARRSAEVQSQTIELCRALIQGEGWKKVAHILSGLRDQDPETIRRAILGYCSASILKSSTNEAMTIAMIMEEMIEPFYDSGFPGLVFACYSVIANR